MEAADLDAGRHARGGTPAWASASEQGRARKRATGSKHAETADDVLVAQIQPFNYPTRKATRRSAQFRGSWT